MTLIDVDGPSGSALSRADLLRLTGTAAAGVTLPGALARAAGATVGGRAAPFREISQLTWALSSTPRSLDFIHSFDLATPTIMALALESLMQFGPDLRIRPNLARSVSRPDPVTYVYKLRSGVKFWDGSPLTAEDVAFSMNKHLDPKAGSELASYYGSVKWIQATHVDEITIKLKSPDATFQYIPAFFTALVVKKQFWQDHAKNIGSPGVLTMGTGPYRIVEYAPDDSVRLERNESYWGPKPAAKTIVIKFIPEAATRLLAMRSGGIDGAFEVPPDQIQQWRSISDARVIEAPSLETEFFEFDLLQKPFGDIHVRRAFAHALDTRGLVNALLRGHGAAAASIVPPVAWSGLLTAGQTRAMYASLQKYPFDLAKAKQELAQSSAPNGFKATYNFPDSFPEMGKAALSLAENLKQLNVSLDVKQQPFNQWLAENRAHGRFGLGPGIWFMDYLDPADVLDLFLNSKFAVKNGLNNATYENPHVDKLLTLQKSTTSPSVRARALTQVQRIASADLPYLPLWYPSIAMAVRKKYAYRNFGPLYIYQPWARYISTAS
jgi:peptide/nickel transport system substrate-binding protein